LGANLTKKTVFSLRGGKLVELLVDDDDDEEDGGAASPSSKATECAVTRAENPVPSNTPAMIPDTYASTDNPPKSAGTETKVLSK